MIFTIRATCEGSLVNWLNRLAVSMKNGAPGGWHYFQFIAGGDELRTIPETGSRLNGHAIGTCRDKKSEPAYQVVNLVVLFHYEWVCLISLPNLHNRRKDSDFHLSTGMRPIVFVFYHYPLISPQRAQRHTEENFKKLRLTSSSTVLRSYAAKICSNRIIGCRFIAGHAAHGQSPPHCGYQILSGQISPRRASPCTG